MDDSRFDDIIKGKLGDYEPEGFDPTGLTDLHHRMAAVATFPWYVQWRSELLIGSGMVLMTFILLWHQWYWNSGTIAGLNDRIGHLEVQNNEISGLQEELRQLRNISGLADTVQIVEIRYLESPLVASLNERVRQLESQRIQSISEDVIYLGETDLIPKDVLFLLKKADLLYSGDGRSYIVLSKEDRLIPPNSKTLGYASLPGMNLYLPKEVKTGQTEEIGSAPLDGKTAKALNKHYGRGIGIKIGPEANYLFSKYDLGKAEPDLKLGLLADLILSPTLSLETGVRFGQRLIEITDPDQFDKRDFPDQNEFEGDLGGIDIDTKHLEIPLVLKYRRMINPSTDVSIGTGISSYIIWEEDFEYTYDNVNVGGGVISDVRSDQPQKGLKFYPGNVNLVLGVNKQLKNNNRFETSILYQHGVWDVGIEKLSPNFYGVRGVYWFTIR